MKLAAAFSAALCLAPLLAIALTLAPAAAAQDMCSSFRTVMDKAPERFKSLRGDQAAPGMFTAKVPTEAPPFKNCMLYETVIVAIICSRESASRESVALSAYGYLAWQVRQCFPSWSTTPLDNNPMPQYSTVSPMKSQALAAPNDPTHVVTVLLASDVKSGQTTYLLSISFVVAPRKEVS
jgi:hypothetical protein